jgi:hypothetical protein
MKSQLLEADEEMRRFKDDLDAQSRTLAMLELEKLDLMEVPYKKWGLRDPDQAFSTMFVSGSGSRGAECHIMQIHEIYHIYCIILNYFKNLGRKMFKN